MLRLVSRVTEKMKACGAKSSYEVGALLTLYERPYYGEMRELAREVRKRYGLRTPRVELSDLEKICGAAGAKLDIWPGEFRRLRGGYFNDTYGAHVMVMKGLGKDAMVFTIAHELKHHLFDANLKLYSGWHLSVRDPLEVGAEIFAAELIYPETNFRSDLSGWAFVVGQAGWRQSCGSSMRPGLHCDTRSSPTEQSRWGLLLKNRSTEKIGGHLSGRIGKRKARGTESQNEAERLEVHNEGKPAGQSKWAGMLCCLGRVPNGRNAYHRRRNRM